VTERNVVRVADVMETDYAMVNGVATVAEALAILLERNAHFLIVAKRDEDDEFGVVMVADIAKQVLARDRSPERTNVYEITGPPSAPTSTRSCPSRCSR
jgi:signal-transduction protein with cAMP-binding, CBS, and nucleotidyltransferase domain